jgi:hypothetical protein
LEEQEEYSVFNEIPEQKPVKKRGQTQRFLYFVFAVYFLVRAVLRWVYFAAFRNHAISRGEDGLNETTLAYLVSALSTSIILICSLVLFFRKSMRASIALFILGAVLELVIFYLMKPY